MDRNNMNQAPGEKLQDTNEGFPDMTPRRIGGDDSLAEASPIDSRADEKVLTNRNRNDSNREDNNDSEQGR